MTEWRKTKKYNPSGPGYPEAGEYYVLKSEAEEKIAELQAEVARLVRVLDTGVGKDALMRFLAKEERAEAAEAKLRAVAELVPEFYRDELEALLKGGA